MSEIYSIQSIHDQLKKKLVDYIETEYLGKNNALRNALHNELISNGVLYKDLMVEANSGYEISDKKIYDTNLPEPIKDILKKLVSANIGFFEYPYKHQIMALENFYKGKDLLVSTGTGSGKTECFLWPMVSSIVNESKKESWNNRGVRAVILYPMNALVSDQESRLRRMIGDYDDKFYKAFEEISGGKRRPQFGMYTGRTKYSGAKAKAEDNALANTLESAYINLDGSEENEKIIAKLKALGKYPAKHSLERFISELRRGNHYTDSLDAELLTRFEMRNVCPDILITNYSMLEYMMVRPEEQGIWNATINWLNSDSSNKLLFIIDEAHMYKGSSGAEVALLIKRFMSNLGITRDKVQFILTSASFPQNAEEEVNQFACDLTNQVIEKNNFEIIMGEPKKFSKFNSLFLNVPNSFEFDIYKLYESKDKYSLINEYFNKLDIYLENYNPTNDEELGQYLYDFLPKIGQIVEIIKYTRNNAKSIDDIANKVFGREKSPASCKVIEFILAILPLAKNYKQQVLFPTRIHMMFRGINGIYACSNPKCNKKHHNLPFGKLFVNYKIDRCDCGAKVYELVNERNCGALFFKAYETSDTNNFIWNTQTYRYDLKEVPVYIPDKEDDLQALNMKKETSSFGYLNPFTGQITEYKENDNSLPVLLIRRDGEEEYKAFVCPKCEKRNSTATDFSTKGNEPFYNLISQQFHLQPQTIFDSEMLKLSPNGGRKVLVFSDSRSKAAKLARDLTRAADRDAFRKVLVIALQKLHESAEYYCYKPTMDLIYPAFLHVVIIKKVHLFYGSERDELQELLEEIEKVIVDYTDDGIVNYKELFQECDNNILKVYHEEMLYHVCSNFTSLTDLRMCYIEPVDFVLRKFRNTEIAKSGKFTVEDFKKIYAAWIDHILSDTLAYDKTIDDETRKNVRPGVPRYGERDGRFNNKFKGFLKEMLNDSEIEELYGAIDNGLEKDGEAKYLMLSKNVLVFDDKKDWYKCPRCGTIFPYEFHGMCMNCGSKEVRKIDSDDLDGISFYTDPVYDELQKPEDNRILTINTMEHTAQLNTADESEDKVWTNAENYEMRFQDLILNNEEPIDVLSCTTTMEVGVDIGALTAIGLRDVPPLVENYQQRIGRAGRRGTSISTIVTYVENGPHDNYYFKHPSEIISGKLRKPWIDVRNPKLIGRHFSLTIINKFMLENDTSIYHTLIDKFNNEYMDDAIEYVKKAINNSDIYNELIPDNSTFDKDYYISNLIQSLHSLRDRVAAFPEQFKDEHRNFISALDALIIEGVFPNYSFPRDVISFYITDPENPDKILHAPSRSIDVALNEYVPGKLIVVDKKTYRSGGLFMKGKNPYINTKNYFNSQEYYRDIYCCTNSFCSWMNDEEPAGGVCPFCNSEVRVEKLVKPWGFGATDGKAVEDSSKNDSYSTSGTPVYAIVSDEDKMQAIDRYQFITVENKYNQKLAIVNRGVQNFGFTVCKKCGGAVLNTSPNGSKNRITTPFKVKDFYCNHNDKETILFGTNDLVTDMALFQTKLDSSIIDCSFDGYWLKKAATTLVQAIILAGTKLLDIDYNELKGGYRVRFDKTDIILEIFIFDSLTSGAGYSSIVSKRASEILYIAETILSDCNCSSSCHNCLENFYNQYDVANLDRFRAYELLQYIKNGSLPKLYTLDEQYKYAKILNRLFENSSKEFYIDENMVFHHNNKQTNVIIYPGMLNKLYVPGKGIKISDFNVEKALPLAYKELTKSE